VTSDQIRDRIVDAIRKVAPDVSGVGAETALTGQDAPLDSVGFVTLLVTLEGDLGQQVDLSDAFMQDGGSASADSPFRTVDTLCSYICRRLEAR
jgi:acyl carrier protein